MADAGLPCTVHVVEPTRSETHVLLKTADVDIVAAFRDRLPLVPGAALHLTADPQRTHLFDAASGDKL